MSLFGAVRLFAIARRDEPSSPETSELPEIRPGAWSAWAHAGVPFDLSDRSIGEVCLTLDGRLGQVVAVFDGGEWRRACQVVQAAAT